MHRRRRRAFDLAACGLDPRPTPVVAMRWRWPRSHRTLRTTASDSLNGTPPSSPRSRPVGRSGAQPCGAAAWAWPSRAADGREGAVQVWLGADARHAARRRRSRRRWRWQGRWSLRAVRPRTRTAHAGDVPLSISLDSNGALGSMGEGDRTQPVEQVHYHDVAVTSLLPGWSEAPTKTLVCVLPACHSESSPPATFSADRCSHARAACSTAPASAHAGPSHRRSSSLGPALQTRTRGLTRLAAAAVQRAARGGEEAEEEAPSPPPTAHRGRRRPHDTHGTLRPARRAVLARVRARATVLPGHAASSLGAFPSPCRRRGLDAAAARRHSGIWMAMVEARLAHRQRVWHAEGISQSALRSSGGDVSRHGRCHLIAQRTWRGAIRALG